MKILSLFDGISCARIALEKAGIPVDFYYASEIDKYAIEISKKNYPNNIHIGSVVDIKSSDYTNIDLLIGGSPCQDLSIAKKNRDGLKGQRSGLFYEYVRIRDEVKPKYFILENVASMPREAKEQITEILGVEPIMINASLVSAQNRKRLFWIGKWNGEKYETVNIEQPEDRGILLKDILEENVDEKYTLSDRLTKTVMSSGTGTYKCKTEINPIKAFSLLSSMHKMHRAGIDNYVSTRIIVNKIEDKVKIRKYPVNIEKLKLLLRENKILTNKEISDKLNEPITKVEHWFRTDTSFSIPDENIWFKLKDLLNINTDEFDKSITEFDIRDGNFDMSKRVYSIDGKSPTITTISGGQQHKIINDTYQIRKLTPIECERLQSLPDNYTDGISNTQRYKCLGNGFNVDVIAHILKNLYA